MESTWFQNTWYAEGRPLEVCISFSLDPYDWYELKDTDAWKEVVRLVEAFGNRDNLLRRLEALNLKEKATSEQVLSSLPPPRQATSCIAPQTDTKSKESPRHPIWQRLKKWISREGTY